MAGWRPPMSEPEMCSPEAETLKEPNVAVVLVNWNSWQDVVACIDSLLGQHYASFHIFVVDNDSTDGSIANIVAWCANPTSSASHDHEGVARYTLNRPRSPIICRVVDRPSATLQCADANCNLTLIRSGTNNGFASGCNVAIRAASPERFEYFWL